ncbi:MAG: hypothetical protein EU536_04035 [Promethearchaeota archaeon]|nr:MAG: hypothetical protein EU536_04035 [Candidatus Lokiarchaeota archaeon]
MEKGDIYGLIGMVTGIQAASDIPLYFLFAMIPLYASYWGLFMVVFYAAIYGGGSVGLILSIIAISKNRSKFGIIGLITAAIGIVGFTIILFI